MDQGKNEGMLKDEQKATLSKASPTAQQVLVGGFPPWKQVLNCALWEESTASHWPEQH